MAIEKIQKSQFDLFNPGRTAMIQMLTEERAWFADAKRNVLGTVLLDKIDNDWSYVVLGRDEQSDFRSIDMNANFATQADAESELLEKMRQYEESGRAVFAQGD